VDKQKVCPPAREAGAIAWIGENRVVVGLSADPPITNTYSLPKNYGVAELSTQIQPQVRVERTPGGKIATASGSVAGSVSLIDFEVDSLDLHESVITVPPPPCRDNGRWKPLVPLPYSRQLSSRGFSGFVRYTL
jgi:hypothetical protein